MFEAVLRFRDVISHENFPLLYIVAIPAVCGSLKSAGTFTSSWIALKYCCRQNVTIALAWMTFHMRSECKRSGGCGNTPSCL